MGCGGSKAAPPAASAGDAGGQAQVGKIQPKGQNEKLLDKYTLGVVLGQGAFGVVYECIDKATKAKFAVKLIDKVESPMSDIMREVEMLEKLRSPVVVSLHDVYYEKLFVYMVLDLLSGGDLIAGMQIHWKSKGMIGIPAVKHVSAQMIAGVRFLHKLNVVHRDVKGDNYLTDRKDISDLGTKVLLSDFGTVIELKGDERVNKSCGTKVYWSPEFYDLKYGLKVDIFAVGIVMFGLFTGKFPFRSESDTRNKSPSLPGNVPGPAKELTLKMLEKSEAKRIDSESAGAHAWLTTEMKIIDEIIATPADFVPEVQEAGAHGGQDARRQELVARLQDQAEGKTAKGFDELAKGFSVDDARRGRNVKYAWWPAADFEKQGSVKITGATPAAADDMVANALENTQDMMKSHNIDTSKFGQGQAKTFPQFMEEIQNGSARLMLDAAKHKCIVRLVDIVLMRITMDIKGKKCFLIKTSEVLADGRESMTQKQLPGTKKLVHENAVQTARRLIEERLKLTELKITFNVNSKEDFEETEDSSSYPGVQTVYRKEILECQVTVTDPGILVKSCGADWESGGKFETTDGAGIKRSYVWMDEASCTQEKVKLRAPKGKDDVSALVLPPCGFEQDELREFLKKNGVDEAKFDGKDGTRSIKDFADELVKGEASLCKVNGVMSRVVDVVILKVTNANGSILVETEETVNGQSKTLNRLPAVKRRSDENQFLATRRILQMLNVDTNFVQVKTDNVGMLETESDSKSYPGLTTKYQKRIITGTFQVPA